ncbi:LysR family transcriptional regulator [Pseudomonas matsuisoli]|uniref:LysR family transcriptional regulator n=1 Tax=Pseudomonas matsuisoli TaxID=1515666 RepID=A0A917PME7_9PSED|nr:LysR substrate-binding domain-containing protein [Pseudomonas matsuisoli]GGJ84108.1 LysR family transcriptional regulator [Pseudomonas matsuisoli]
MELIWLEDLVAIAEHGSFSRAAESRHVTQPAFSRRIRAMETWIGTALFERTPQGAVPTEAGRHVLAGARDMARRLHQIRSEAQEIAGKSSRTLRFAATHSLSFIFFPRWIREIERNAPLEAVRLLSDNMQECERLLEHGQAQFLLGYHHPDVAPSLPDNQFTSRVIGTDLVLPLCATQWTMPANAIPYLGYSPESGLGRIIESTLSSDRERLMLERRFESHLATVLMSMALESKGIAWLPLSLAEQELRDGRLCRALDESWDVPVQIRIMRARTRLSPFAEAFWERLNT